MKTQKLHLNHSFTLLFLLFLLMGSISYVLAEDEDEEEDEDEDDDEDLIKNLGVAAIGLLALNLVYPIVFKTYMYRNKKLSNEDENEKNKKTQLREKFMKVKDPLQKIHFYLGGIAIILVIVHGINLISEDDDNATTGLIMAIILVFYGISGLILKTPLRNNSFIKKHSKILRKIHVNLLLLFLAVGLHVLHFAE